MHPYLLKWSWTFLKSVGFIIAQYLIHNFFIVYLLFITHESLDTRAHVIVYAVLIASEVVTYLYVITWYLHLTNQLCSWYWPQNLVQWHVINNIVKVNLHEVSVRPLPNINNHIIPLIIHGPHSCLLAHVVANIIWGSNRLIGNKFRFVSHIKL